MYINDDKHDSTTTTNNNNDDNDNSCNNKAYTNQSTRQGALQGPRLVPAEAQRVRRLQARLGDYSIVSYILL